VDSSAYRSIWPLAGVAKGRRIEEGRIHRSSRPSRERGSREIASTVGAQQAFDLIGLKSGGCATSGPFLMLRPRRHKTGTQ
jgi:hypothetical protein